MIGGRLQDILSDLREELLPFAGIFNEDSDRLHFLKCAICDVLTDRELRLLLLYLHFGSYRKVASVTGESHQTVARRFRQVRMKLLHEYEKRKTKKQKKL